MHKPLRDHLLTAAGALLFLALHALALDAADQLDAPPGQIGTTSAELIAATDHCHCQEACR